MNSPRKQPKGRTPAGKAPTSAIALDSKQVNAATALYNNFCAAGSNVTVAQFAVGMADYGVWSKKEAAGILGITTTHLNQAAAGKVDGTGATDDRRENLRRTAANRIGVEFAQSAFAVAKRAKIAAAKAAPAPAAT